jgi:hypothetical protein
MKKYSVTIHNMDTGRVYTAHQPDDCRNDGDLEVFKLARQHGQTVAVGIIVGQLRTDMVNLLD